MAAAEAHIVDLAENDEPSVPKGMADPEATKQQLFP